ncbi:MAG: DUF951 domain-containing protein [Clostridia bacterium]|nr:DUF951 domain-containing protein [Clostridia bacterium]
MLETFALGDTVQMKKPHACGSNAWRITRVGADVKIRCIACGRVVMLDRQEFMRAGKRILAHEDGET